MVDTIIISVVQMRKLEHREVKSLTQSHTASIYWSDDSSPGLLNLELQSFLIAPPGKRNKTLLSINPMTPAKHVPKLLPQVRRGPFPSGWDGTGAGRRAGAGQLSGSSWKCTI